ncbi:MAG: hypothetical protein VB048_07985, partial [Bacteroidaceae bacterium]|nr:hypothetical protein [Bacteroidaceae bacterium]
ITKDFDFSLFTTLQDTIELPILAWMGVPETHTTVEHFLEMKNAGININHSNYSNADSLQKALDIAHQLDMRLMIRCPELYSDTETTVIRFKDHPANGGYFLQDEPFASSFPFLKQLVEKIKSIDNNHFCYINLNPNYAIPEFFAIEGYKKYVQSFLDEIPVKILSFDHYPIIDNFVRTSWYQNLEIIKAESDIADISFWAFALTTAHNSYPIPNLNQLRLQVYSNLAYGAKGIQYFTYWTPNSQRWNFHSGPIEFDGTRTIVYDYIKELNNEIQNLSYIFLSSKVIKISHFGDEPQGTSRFSTSPNFVKSINIRGGNALLSEMKNDKHSFLLIQNTNLHKEIGIDIKTDTQTKIVLKNRFIIQASVINEEFKLTPGEIVIFMR